MEVEGKDIERHRNREIEFVCDICKEMIHEEKSLWHLSEVAGDRDSGQEKLQA